MLLSKAFNKVTSHIVFIFPSPLNTINIYFKSFPVFLCPLSVLFIISTSFLSSLSRFFSWIPAREFDFGRMLRYVRNI